MQHITLMLESPHTAGRTWIPCSALPQRLSIFWNLQTG
jgi:hypothetical protein